MTLTGLSHHLWQSTLFALLAGLLSVMMRRERARVRYWLWLAASVKFFIPFAWLGALGSGFAQMSGVGAVPGHRLAMAIDVIAGVNPGIEVRFLASIVPVLIRVWVCGCVGVIVWWCLGWWKISRAMREGVALHEGREVEMLRRVEARLRIKRPTEIVRSRVMSEPGVFGIARAVLMWPEGVSERLTDLELEAILTHEVRHAQRKDNLTAAVHMVVEAVFWFHPLVWWVGARLVEERERACDEDVVALGSEPRAYAAGILKVCEFCLRSPLVCMAGVAGGDLKKRMVSIMTNRMIPEMSTGKKVLLAVAGVAAIAGPMAVGALHASDTRTAMAAVASVGADQGSEHSSVQASKSEMQGMIVKKVPPAYPEAARKAKIQGEVLLHATIGTTGSVEKLEVVSGPAELSPAVVEAVKQWKYRPYKKDGRVVEVETDITVNFTLVE